MLSALLIAAAAMAVEPPEFDKFFEDFSRKRAAIRLLQAEYTEKSITPDETFLSEGALLFAQPRRIVRTTHYPYDSTVVIDNQTSIEYEPEVKQAVISNLAEVREADILFFAFDSDTRRLRENYDVKLFAIADNPLGRNGIEIRPKGSDGEKPFDSVTLYLNDETMLPYRMQVIFDEESELQVDIGEYTINGAVPPERTQIFLPEGTKLIEQDKVVETIGTGGKRLPGPSPIASATAATPGPPADETPAAEPALVEVKPLD